MFDDPRAALDGFVELEVQMRREFQHDALRDFVLQEPRGCRASLAIAALPFRFRPDDADEDVRVLQIGRDVHLLHGDERGLESDLALDEFAEFALEHFVDAFETVFHGS